jgi:uncharacterized protein
VSHRRLPKWLDGLLHLHDTPRRTAAAFTLGVFFSFSPFIGLQILASFGLAFLFRLNRLAVFVGLNANLPWIIVPWYVGTTVAASHVLGIGVPATIRDDFTAVLALSLLSREFWTAAWRVIEPFLIPYLVGPTVGAALVALVTYPATVFLLTRRTRTPEPRNPGT